MKKENIVKENRDFSRIINEGKKCWNEVFSIYYEKNNCEKYKFGISVSKKIGNAVVRNKIKRQVRNIIDKNKKMYKNNENYIIIIRRNYVNLKFSEIEKKYIELIKKITQKGA